MPMRSTLRARSALTIALLVMLVGCQLPPPSIGTLRTAGAEVTVNGRPAVDGMPIASGDKIATGTNSNARLDFRGGGHVQLAPNTDPTVSEWIEAGRCLITLEVLWGMLFGESGRCQIRLIGENSMTDVLSSRFLFEVAPRRDVFTLIDGRAVMLRPERIEIRPREQVLVVDDRIVARQMLTPAEIERLIAWRHRFDLERIQVPSLERVPLDVARSRLAEAGLRIGRVERRETEAVPDGWVMAQRPAGGTIVQRSSVVDLQVATRPPVREVLVPDLAGLTEQDAERGLRAAGLRLGRGEVLPSGRGDVAIVVDQRPPRGTRVPEGTAVDIVLQVTVQ